MKIFFISIFLILSTLYLNGQDCNIFSKANRIVPDKLCSPLSVTWQINYTGVNNAGRSVQILYNWDDGSSNTVTAVSLGPGIFQADATHTYVSTGDKCNYRPSATLVVNGVICASSTQEQIVTVWDNDDHNGGHMHINPTIFPVCFGTSANVRFQDVTQFNCVPPQENDVPNLYTRWVQWIYGTDITMTGSPVTINGTIRSFPYSGPITILPGPVTGSGIYTDLINVASDKLIGQYFQVTLRNWNYCNPYDDPNIPGPPSDLANGDHPPVVTTAIILIVAYPDATITPISRLCVNNNSVTLRAHDSGGIWSGDGVTGNTFNPTIAGVGNHIIRYDITNASGCSDNDEITIIVVPKPDATITPVGTLCVNSSIITLFSHDLGGIWSGSGVVGNTFNPTIAGVGNHLIKYNITNASGCSDNDEITVTVVPLPDATITPIGILCVNSNPVTLNAHDPGGIWSGPGVVGNIFNPTIAGVGNHLIKYNIVNTNGCRDNDEITIIVVPKPDATITPVGTLCVNSSIITLFSHDLGGIWSGPGVAGNTFNPTIAGAGNHIIRYNITNSSGCNDKDEITIMVAPKPYATITPIGIICSTDSIITLSAHDPGGIWTGDAVVGNTFNPTIAGPGNHIIRYNITDANGCRDNDEITVTIVTPDATITPIDTLCFNSLIITLTAHDSGGIWTGPGVAGNTFNPTIAGPGNHLIKYNIINPVCKDADSTIITVMPIPIVTIDSVGVLFINSSPVTLHATPIGGVFSGKGVTGNIFNPGIAGIGTHIIQYEPIPDKYGCLKIDTIHIKVILPPPPIADWEPDTTGCSPLTVQFVNNSLYGEAYLWDFGDKIFSNEKNPIHTYYIPGNYIVKLMVINVTGTSLHNGIIRVYQNPTAIFDAYPTDIVNNEQVVIFYNNSYYDSLHLWQFGDGQTSIEKNPYHKYLTAGTYNVSLLITSKDGCIDSAILNTPIIVDWKIGSIKFPNVFKWNQTGPTGGQWREGVNAEMDFVFRPFFENVIEYKLQIFNRWGVLIYESYDLYKGWDGYFADGNLAVQGVYVWKVTGRYADGKYFTRVGDVTFLH